MMTAILLALTAQPGQAPAPKPWEITGTSSIAEISAPEVTHKVDNRAMLKNERIAVRAGFSYLSRGDLRTNPGVSVEAGWYPRENVGIDFISATVFFSELTGTAAALREQTGLLPDSEKPLVRAMTGVRFSFAYGKLLFEELDAVLHFDASGSAHLGLLITDDAPNPAVDLGVALQVSVENRFLVWLEAGWFLSYENRTESSFASGPIGTAGVGVML